MSSRRLLRSLLGAFVVALSFAATTSLCVAADSLEYEAKAAELAQQVMSPFCPGRSLNDCPSAKAHDLKSQIRVELEAGKSPEQILEGIFTEYGDQYRAVPKYEGFGRVAWWAPMVFIIAGLLLAVSVVIRRNRSEAGAESSTEVPHLTEEQRRQIEDELKQLE